MRPLTHGLLWAAAGLLAACAGATPPPLPEPDYVEKAMAIPPTITQAEAKRLILANKARLWKDPDSVRDAKIGPPFTCLTGSGNCICVEVNAKNSYGGFTGLQLMGIRLDGPAGVEALGEMMNDARQKVCGQLVAFRELEGRGKK